MGKLFKSIWAVVAGFAIVLILSTVTDFVLESLGVFPPISQGLFVTWMLVLALAYRTVYSVLGGFVTAYLAPHKPMKHVMVLAIIGFVAAMIGLIVTWNMNLGPHWYPILLALLSVPSVWLGGKLSRNN